MVHETPNTFLERKHLLFHSCIPEAWKNMFYYMRDIFSMHTTTTKTNAMGNMGVSYAGKHTPTTGRS
eukprot:3192488-Pyramimonas_sp.AAC.1